MLIKVELVQNPKAMRKRGFVAKLHLDKPTDQCLEFLKAGIPEYSKSGVLVAGEFDLNEGDFYIVRKDTSSHKNSRQCYELITLKNGTLTVIAAIDYLNGTPSFFPAIAQDFLKAIYARSKNPIHALHEYAKHFTSVAASMEKT